MDNTGEWTPCPKTEALRTDLGLYGEPGGLRREPSLSPAGDKPQALRAFLRLAALGAGSQGHGVL